MQDFSYRTKPMLSVADPDLEPSWGGGGGGGRFFCRLPCRLFFLLRFFLFFFLPKIRGWGGGELTPGSLPSIHYCTYYEHHIREGMNVGNLNHALRLWTFPPVPKNIPFGSSLAYHNQKKKSVQSSSSSFEDTGGVLFDR